MFRSSIVQNEQDKVAKFGRFEYNKTLMIVLSIILTFPALLMIAVFQPLTDWISTSTLEQELHPIWMLGFLSIPIIFMAVIHEWVHGKAASYLLQDVEVHYGVKLMYGVLPAFYTNFEGFVYRNQFLAILVAPLVVLTPIYVVPYVVFAYIGTGWSLVIAGMFYFSLVFNTIGAIGDLMGFVMMLKYPSTVLIDNKEEDLYGADIWTSVSTTQDIDVLKELDSSGSRWEKPSIFTSIYLVIAFGLHLTVSAVMLFLLPPEDDSATFLIWRAYTGFTEVTNSDGSTSYLFEAYVEILNFPLYLLIVLILSIPVYFGIIRLINRRHIGDDENKSD